MINIRYYLRRKKYKKIILESQCQSVSEEDKQKNNNTENNTEKNISEKANQKRKNT